MCFVRTSAGVTPPWRNETAAAVLGYNPYAASVFGNVIICGRDKSGSPVGLSDDQELSLWRRLDRVLRGAARAR